MSREIKFRAWSTNLKKMSKPFTLKSDVMHFANKKGLGTIKGLQDEIIMQYTGLKDRRGQEIYEGDILKFKSLPAPYSIIEFNLGSFGYFCMKGKDYEYFIGIERTYDKPKNWEIIGNIHENPELLK